MAESQFQFRKIKVPFFVKFYQKILCHPSFSRNVEQFIDAIQDIFEECIPLFIALGDRTRLTILQCLFETQTTGEGRIPGLNVNEITDRTSLSRPAVSHHLKILKDTGLIDVLRKGVCNYYYLTNKSAIDKLGRLKEELEKYPES